MVFKKMKIEDNLNLLSINFPEIINEINKNNFKTDFDLVFNTSDSNISIIHKNIYKNNQAEFYTVITTNAFEIILLNLNKENKNINIIKDLSKNGNIFNLLQNNNNKSILTYNSNEKNMFFQNEIIDEFMKNIIQQFIDVYKENIIENIQSTFNVLCDENINLDLIKYFSFSDMVNYMHNNNYNYTLVLTKLRECIKNKSIKKEEIDYYRELIYSMMNHFD